MLPFHRVFEQEKVDWKIKCFRVIKKAQDWKNKSKRLGVNAIKKKKQTLNIETLLRSLGEKERLKNSTVI